MKTESGKHIVLAAEDGASLSSGSLRLYAMVSAQASLSTLHSPLSTSAVVGCIDLYNYDPLNRRCAVGIMVAKDHRRQGYALAMLKELEKLYSGQWSVTTIHTLYADLAASNTASIALFAKAGYTQCGLFKEWLYLDERLKVKGEKYANAGQDTHHSPYMDSIRMQKLL